MADEKWRSVEQVSNANNGNAFRLYVAEKRMPAVFGLFRAGSKYRARLVLQYERANTEPG